MVQTVPAVRSIALHGSTSPTADDIEMRVCSDKDRDNEDVPIAHVEIYVH